MRPACADRGRPSVYSDAMAEEICNRLAVGESLKSICQDDGMPDERAVRRWSLDPDHPFSPRYARAREYGFQRMADELLEIADGATPEDVQSARLRCDTRKWMLAKMLPKVYGDKLTQEHAGKIETTETPAEPRALARAVLAILNAAKLKDKEPQ
jgi:hypothetical protein